MDQSKCSLRDFVLGVKVIVSNWWNKIVWSWKTRDFNDLAPMVFCVLIVVFTGVIWMFVGDDLHVPVFARVVFSLLLGVVLAGLAIVLFDALSRRVRALCKLGQQERNVRREEQRG